VLRHCEPRPHRRQRTAAGQRPQLLRVQQRGRRAGPHATGPTNRYGYDVEFDAQAKAGDLRIDFAAMAEHLVQLHVAARARGIGLALVIFDPPLLPRLLDTPHGPYLRQHLPFMKGQAWVRHDEHYHVDFAVPCQPLPR
jgi:penicillin-insensitive murein endopeptidase